MWKSMSAPICAGLPRLVLDAVHRRAEPLDLVGRRPLRGTRSGGRLDDLAHLEERVDEFLARILVDLPAQNVRIEHVPVDRRANTRPDLRPRDRQALGRQQADRFAHGRPRNAELRLDARLGRQGVARLVLARDDAAADRAGDHLRQALLAVTTRVRDRRTNGSVSMY